MKYIKFLLLSLIVCFSYANENKYIFVGKNESQGSEKTAFVLVLSDENLQNQVQIMENGEVYIKVDKIVTEPLENFIALSKECVTTANPQNSNTSLNGSKNSYDEMEIRCKNPKCRYTYIATPWNRQCPRCGTYN